MPWTGSRSSISTRKWITAWWPLCATNCVPWLEAHAPVSEEHQRRMAADPRLPRFTLIFDREGYSPELFLELQKNRIAALTYHRYPEEDWPLEEFQEQAVKLANGATVRVKLAERGTKVGKRPWLWAREVRRLVDGNRQISMVSTHFAGDAASLAAALMARWSQENFFKYMREHYGLDALAEYGTETIPATVTVLNPVWRNLNREVRKKLAELKNCRQSQQSVPLDQTLSESVMRHYEQRQGQLQEEIESRERQLETLKKQRKATPRHIPVQDLRRRTASRACAWRENTSPTRSR